MEWSELKICDIKWDKRGTPLIVSAALGYYHHYYNQNGELTVHLKIIIPKKGLKLKQGLVNLFLY